jgi:hypothetical protein
MPSRFAVLACFNLVTNADTNLGVYVLERQIRDFATTGSLRSASPQCGSLGPRTTDLGTTVLKKYYRVSVFSQNFYGSPWMFVDVPHSFVDFLRIFINSVDSHNFL